MKCFGKLKISINLEIAEVVRSSSQGIMAYQEARLEGIGREILHYIW